MTGRYIGSYTDDQSNLPIKSNTVVDVRYTLTLPGFIGGDETMLSIGAINLFDVDPPRIGDRPIYDTEVHDLKGRQVYVRTGTPVVRHSARQMRLDLNPNRVTQFLSIQPC